MMCWRRFPPERLWGPKAYYPDGQVYFGGLKSVDKIDDYTVRFTTLEHDAVLEHRLSSYMSFIICDEALNKFKKDGVDHKIWMDEAATALRWNPVGTGPYKFVDYQKNDRVRLAAFDAYYEGKPAAKTVTFKSVPEVAARIAGLVAGDFDIAVEIPPDQWESLKALSRPDAEDGPSRKQPHRGVQHQRSGAVRQEAAPCAQPLHRPQGADRGSLERPDLRAERLSAPELRPAFRQGPRRAMRTIPNLPKNS